MPTLTFQVQSQQIRRTDSFYVVAKSRNYLYANFTFSADWGDGTKTAQFRNACSVDVYEVLLDANGRCLVPWEVLQTERAKVEVTVFSGDLITANTASFLVHDTGYSEDGESSHDPTPSVYQQILDRMDNIEDDMVDATQRAEEAATSAETSADKAEEESGKAQDAATQATAKAEEASTYATDANDSADAAEAAKSQAVASALEASTAQDAAISARDDAISAKEAAESALSSIQALLEDLQELTLSMEDTAGNETLIKVLGKTVGG